MFENPTLQITIPSPPYPLCDKKDGGTMFPVLIPSEYVLAGTMTQRDGMVCLDTKHPQMRWRCSICKKEV